ncbi:MAG: AMP-binding protein [Hyphomicrobiales bacterium]
MPPPTARTVVPFPGLHLHNGSISVKKLSTECSSGAAAEEADIDIWVLPDASMAPMLEAQSVLSDEERHLAGRYKKDAGRTRYIAVRTLLRLALSHRMRNALAGGDWRFSINAHGKPELCPEQANCSFSITHADGFSVVAIAPDRQIGIDAEKVDRAKLKHLPIDLLSANEQNRLNAQPRDDRHYDFFRLWTLKEAYTKALGEGLSHDFGSLEFNLDATPGETPVPGPDVADAENYELLTLKYFEFNHLLAICLLDVAGSAEHQPTKNLYLVEPSRANARAAGRHTQDISEENAMPPYLQIIDRANPERIELFAFGDLSSLLHEMFEAQSDAAARHPALEFDGGTLSYNELNMRANAVANYLIGRGVAPGDFVALYQDKGPDLIVGMLGILKTGAAYLPVDPALEPGDAVDLIAAYDAKFVLTTRELSDNLRPAHTDKLVLVDEERGSFQVLASQEGFLNAIDIAPDSASHVIFTADAPRGVTVNHREAANFVCSLVPVYGLDVGHRCFQDRSVAIDVALEEICAMLSVGATVVFSDVDFAAAPDAAAEMLGKRGITLMSTVPEVLDRIEAELSTVDILIVGGRRCPTELAVRWAMKTRRLVSLKRPDDRFPSFSIERETRAVSRPRLLFPRASDRVTARHA